MEQLSAPSDVRRRVEQARCAGRQVGFVPTMGALHEGHRSLVRAAVDDCDVVVVSVFVNPLQFGPGEDFDRYPRDLDRDAEALGRDGADVLFAPAADALTPPTLRTTVHVAGLAETLEGASRPAHFDGVATIVTKLLSLVRPDRAYFGEKDYQQLCVVRQLAGDLHLGCEIVARPTVREPDGLALSSRNAYLDADQRVHAVALSQALFAVQRSWAGDASWARTALARMLDQAPGLRCDYAEVCDPDTLEPLDGVVDQPARVLAAVWVGDDAGATRLIDNVRLDPPPAG